MTVIGIIIDTTRVYTLPEWMAPELLFDLKPPFFSTISQFQDLAIFARFSSEKLDSVHACQHLSFQAALLIGLTHAD